MADIKISELGAALTVGDSDVLPMTASGVTSKVSTSLLKDYVIGTTDISTIGDGTVTGAIDAINTDMPDGLDDLDDVSITTPADGEAPVYDSVSQKFKNTAIVTQDEFGDVIAPIEVSPSAHAYSVGKQLLYNNVLYTVTSPIAVSDALTEGTNIEVSPKTVIEQVEDNASEIDDLWDAQQTLGAWNLLETTLVTQVKDSVTWTANADGTVNANGTTSADSRITIGKANLSEGTYYLSGCATPPNTNDYRLRLSRTVGGVETVYWNDDATSITTVTVTSAYAGEWVLEVRYGNTKVMSDALFKPMIAIKAGLPYVPHAMTNKELTDALGNVKEIRTGKFNFTNGASISGSVTYDTPFTGAGNKVVLVTPESGSTTQIHVFCVNGQSNTGFNYIAKNITGDTSSSNRVAQYIAISY